MEDFYWIGYSVALIVEIILTFYGLVVINSIKAKNFEKVWLFYSLYQLTYAEWDKPWFFKQTMGVVFRLLINPFFSWLDLWWHIIRFWVIINQKISTPEKVKEVQYKLGATLLNKEEVKSLVKQSVSYLWKNIEFEDDRLVLEYDTDDYGWYADIQVDTINKKLVFYSRSSDYDQYYDTYEYKIEWAKVFTRLIEQLKKYVGEGDTYYVKDGVLLEEEILERYNEGIWNSLGTADERISELQKALEWNDDLNYKVKYFVLSKHPEVLPVWELRKFYRAEIERLKKGHKKYLALEKDPNIHW